MAGSLWWGHWVPTQGFIFFFFFFFLFFFFLNNFFSRGFLNLKGDMFSSQFLSAFNYSRVHTAGCKSTCHQWQVPPGGAPVVSGGENAAGCNLPLTKSDLPLTFYLWQTTEVTWATTGGNFTTGACGQLSEVNSLKIWPLIDLFTNTSGSSKNSPCVFSCHSLLILVRYSEWLELSLQWISNINNGKAGVKRSPEEMKELLRIWKEPDIREAIAQPSNKKKSVGSNHRAEGQSSFPVFTTGTKFHLAQLAPGVSAGGKLGVDVCKG